MPVDPTRAREDNHGARAVDRREMVTQELVSTRALAGAVALLRCGGIFELRGPGQFTFEGSRLPNKVRQPAKFGKMFQLQSISATSG